MSAAKKQESAVNAWQAKQTNFRQQEQARQEDMRKQADAARVQGLDKLSREQQDAARATEEERLKDYLQGGAEGEQAGEAAPVSVADAQLSGQNLGDENFKTDMAKKINEATTDARGRIARLARVSAYGDSSMGLGRQNQTALLGAGRGIDMANNARQCSLAALGTEKAIRPVEMTYSDPFADAQLSGQNLGDENFKTDMAKKINEATTDARGRIARLARVSAYGDSSMGLGRQNQNALLGAGRGIDMANNARQGSLAAFGTEKAIRPVEMTYSDPFADAFSTALQVGSAGLGKAYSDGSFSKRAPAAKTSADPWAGLRTF